MRPPPTPRWPLVVSALILAVTAGCEGISSGPGGNPGDVDLYDVEIDVDPTPTDGSSDTGGGGDGQGGGPSTPVPTPDPDEISDCEDRWQAYLTPDRGADPARPDSDAYEQPPAVRRESLELALQQARRNQWSKARESLDDSGYEVCRVEARDSDILVWHSPGESRGWPRLALRLDREARPLFVQTPHPYTEPAAAEQTIALFDRLDARALLVAGAHRCADTAESRCDGESDVCTDDDTDAPYPYRMSDMAHAPETFFQLFHRNLSAFFAEATVLSLHADAKRQGAVLSNGTTEAADRDVPVAALGDALASTFPDQTVSYCNRIPERPKAERGCGTTNLQGRYLNGVLGDKACRNAAPSASGRFLRLEHNLVGPGEGVELVEPVRNFLDSR